MSPKGTIVDLINQSGGSKNLIGPYVFDDSALQTIGSAVATPIPSGSYLATTSGDLPSLLSTFNGELSDGIWTLLITDYYSQDTGSLGAWSLLLITSPAPVAASEAPSGPGRNEPDPVFYVTDIGAIASSLYSSVPTAIGLRESSFQSSRTGINVFGSRLHRLRNMTDGTSNTILIQEGRPNTNIQDGTSNTVIVGEGDGPEVNKSSKSAKNVLPPSVHIAKPQRWEIYTSFNYSNLDMDEDVDFEGLRSNTYSSGIGAEYALTPYLTLGLGTSYTTSDVKGGGDSGNTDVEGFTFVGYASAYWKGIYADLLYGATFLENDIDRDTGLGKTAHAEPNSVVQSINFNTGYNFSLGQLVTGPYAGIDYAYSHIDGYTEHGGGTANTKVSGQTNHSLLTRLGWQASCNIVKPWGKITPQINAGWERENLNSTDDLTVGLVQSPFYRVQGNSIRSAGGSFSSTVSSPGRAADYLTAGAALVIEVGTRFNVVLDYQGQFFADNFTAHYAGIKLGYKF
ncbi:MAG: hypothetical protein RL693_1095 [Verrucomicrobiota bacterium]|jgi:uncharacterized protein YhjY with autotransporter beta-barrel domain